MTNEELALEIHNKAIDCGFDNCGIVPLSDFLDEYKEKLEERIKKIPSSDMFYQRQKTFTKLKEDYPWAKSVIVVTSWYGKYKYPENLQGKYAKAFMLAMNTNHNCKEYKQKLEFEKWLSSLNIRYESDEKYAPSGFFPLRQAAVSAGLGILRKNNFFYTEKGSYYNLSGYLIDKPLIYKQECNIRPCPDKCNICQNSCPTKALYEPYTMNPFYCVSFLTTFAQGQLFPPLTDDMLENWICGCDTCQDVCPNNRKQDWSEGIDFEGLNEIVSLLQPENILRATDEELIEKVIPKTDFHLTSEQTHVLKSMADRVLKLQK